jgi:hypothetical protein
VTSTHSPIGCSYKFYPTNCTSHIRFTLKTPTHRCIFQRAQLNYSSSVSSTSLHPYAHWAFSFVCSSSKILFLASLNLTED